MNKLFNILLGIVGFIAVILLIMKSEDALRPDIPLEKMTDEQLEAYKKRKNIVELLIFALIAVICAVTGIHIGAIF